MKILFKNANIYPITSEPFKGDLLIENGKIKKLAKNIRAKADEVIDVEGKYIFPGFVDAHSHIGVFEEGVGEGYYQDGNEMTDPNTAQVRVIDAFYPEDAAIKRALEGGVTTVMVVPGSANPIGGQGAILKFKSKIVDEMIIKEPAGLKMAMGENPKRVYGSQKKLPSTRLGSVSVIREYFLKVQNYMKKKEKGDFYDFDLKMEIGEKVLKREIPARIHAHRADDIITAIRLSEEFGFDLVIEHATEAYKIADYIKEKGVPLVLGPLFGFRTKLELKDMSFEALRIINEKGILAGLMCDHPVLHLEHANVQAALGMRYGAKEEDLIKMLTINPAKILKIDDRVGSLEVGKDADIAIWNYHPFDIRAKAESVYIEGKKVL
jgi:imidazolonepropionase-like amidohydrolase